MPADVAAIMDRWQEETLRVRKLRKPAWQSDSAQLVETRWELLFRPSCGRSLMNT